MSDIRCPMCGKTNPAEADVCRYCQARLSPISFESNSEESFDSSEADAGDLPEWLQQSSSSTPKDSGAKTDGDAVPDWLRGLRSDAGDERDFPSYRADEDLSHLSNEGGRKVPEWLKDIYSDTEAPLNIPAVPAPDFDNLEDEDPDLLRRIDSSDASSPHEKLESTDWAEPGKSPEALTSPQAPEAPTDKPSVDETSSEPALPAWLSSQDEEEMLRWLSMADESESGEDVAEIEAAPKPLEEESEVEDENWFLTQEGTSKPIPDISPDLLVDEVVETPSQSIEETKPGDESTEGETGIAGGEFDFDQLSEDAGLSSIVAGEEVNEDLSWLEGMQSDFSAEISEELAPVDGTPLEEEPTAGEMDIFPDWLAESAKPEEAPMPSAFIPEEPQEEIPPADLPSWLKAMRPVGSLDLENTGQEGDREQTERAGPLAGLVGALPAEPDIIESTRPPAYSLKLQVSETQKAHADLLAHLIQSEGEVKALPQPPAIKSQSLMRLVIALVLFAVVLIQLLTGYPTLLAPSISAEVFTAHQLTASLPPEKPVLIVVDYSPGYFGEVESGLESVTSQLIAQGNYLTFVSTIPTGPIQAEYLIAQTTTQNPTAYTNLGYLPGGAPGIQAFAQDPRRSLPYDTQAQLAWQTPQLGDIKTLSDFAMVIIATENSEVARVWIEQAQPLMGKTPILMVVSAQNEPLVRPYYEAYPKQVQGLLGGLAAATQYKMLVGTEIASFGLWSPFAAALTAAVILLLIGALLNASAGYLARSKQNVQSEGKA